jgi:type I restriction-modification system DNA methylase subunit
MSIVRTQQRIDKTGEIFTPIELVNEILDKLPIELFKDADKTFCDPAAGDGNFLEQILLKKLQYSTDTTRCLKSIYGVELMQDNVDVCRARLLDITEHTQENIDIVEKNIVCANSLKYDFSFGEPIGIENWCS